jgi:large subunit ribosomal protein L10
MSRAAKTKTVADLADQFRNSTGAVLTEYRGLTVAQLKELRVLLRGHADYTIVKNTLTRRAAQDAGVEGFDELLTGPSAIAFVTGDVVEASKGLKKFRKEHPALVVKGGFLDGQTMSPSEIDKMADLESREVLLSRLAGGMKASLSQAASLFQAPLAQAVRTVEALRVKAEADLSVLAAGAGEPVEEPAAAADAGPVDTDDAPTSAAQPAADAPQTSADESSTDAEAPAEATAEESAQQEG